MTNQSFRALRGRARSEIGDDQWQIALREGTLMTREQAVDYALSREPQGAAEVNL